MNCRTLPTCLHCLQVLAHRLGLLPLTADPRQFSWPPPDWSPDTGTEKDTLEFSLAVRDDI